MTITVEMLDGGHPLIRVPMAFATRKRSDGKIERIAGQINLSIETLEEAKTLHKALGTFIAFHERFTPEAGRLIEDFVIDPLETCGGLELDEEIRRQAS